ncbi:hypothetical protein ACFE04_002253 [Oxalis oulophora]
MASLSLYSINSNLVYRQNNVVSLPNLKPPPFFTNGFFFQHTLRPRRLVVDFSKSANSITASSSASDSFDVVVIGAGIVGLSIARQFLLGSDLSVAVVDKAVPCSGATGAGQGYIWMAHKTPGTDTWDLTMRSRQLWQMLADSLHQQGLDPSQVLGWKKTGSILIGRSPEESSILKQRVKVLSEAGIAAEYLSSSDLLLEEPELKVDRDSAGAYILDDSQLDAHRTVAYIEEANRQFASIGRYGEFYNSPVTGLLRSGSGREVIGVQTSENTLYSNKAIVVAAGCWSGSLMHELLKDSDISLNVPVKPRKGHLLVLEKFNSLQLNHGLMELGYVGHAAAKHSTSPGSGTADHGQNLSVSMTATMDTVGNLILGSSRQFAGFNTEVEEYIIDLILKRAGDFFPKLKELSLVDAVNSTGVRIGLRPYMPQGKPVIGHVPKLSNLYLATGHEGGGLSMALGTAEMVADMVLGNTGKVDFAPYAVQG